MAKDVAGKGVWTEELLAIIFAIVIVLGFVGVYGVEAYWDRMVPETVYETNLDTMLDDFPTGYTFDHTYGLASGDWNMTGGSFLHFRGISSPYQLDVFELTPVYMGNGSYMLGIPGPFVPGEFSPSPGPKCRGVFEFVIPDTDTFYINDISTEIYLGGLSWDLTVAISVWDATDSILVYDLVTPANNERLFFAIDSYGVSSGWVNNTWEMDLNDAVNVYQLSQAPNRLIMISVTFEDSGQDGWDAETMDFKIVVNGTRQKTVSTSGMVAWVLGGTGVLNIFVGLMATDQIDLKGIGKKAIDIGKKYTRGG